MLKFLLAEAGTSGPDNNVFLLIVLGLLVVVGIFTIIPQRRKQRNMMEMSSRIKVGDKIKTAGGIFGHITDYNEEQNTFTISSGNTSFEIDRAFVYSMEMLGFKPTPEQEGMATDEDVAPAVEDNAADAPDVADVYKDSAAVETDGANTPEQDNID